MKAPSIGAISSGIRYQVRLFWLHALSYKEIAGKGLEHNNEAEEQHLDALCLTRAVENNIAFIYVNAAGIATFPNGSSDHLVGHSQIALPMAGTVAKLNHNHEEMMIQDVDLSFLEMAGEIYKLRAE